MQRRHAVRRAALKIRQEYVCVANLGMGWKSGLTSSANSNSNGEPKGSPERGKMIVWSALALKAMGIERSASLARVFGGSKLTCCTDEASCSEGGGDEREGGEAHLVDLSRDFGLLERQLKEVRG